MYTAQDLDNKTQGQLVAILNDELGYTIAAAEAKKLKNARLREMVLEIQAVTQAQEPETQIHPDIESQEVDELDDLLNSAYPWDRDGASWAKTQSTPEEVMALEAKLEQDCLVETLLESQDDDDSSAIDEVMSPQEQLVDNSAQVRVDITQDDKLGRMLAEGLKTLQPESITTHPIIQYLTRLADAGDAEARQFLQTQSTWLQGVKGSSSNRRTSRTALLDNSQIKFVKTGSKRAALLTMLHQGATVEQIQNGLGWKNKASVVAEITRVRELGYNYQRDGELYKLVLPEGISEPAVA